MTSRKNTKMDDQATGEISRRLKEFYESVQEEGVPPKFLDLLEKLDEAEKSAKSGEKS